MMYMDDDWGWEDGSEGETNQPLPAMPTLTGAGSGAGAGTGLPEVYQAITDGTSGVVHDGFDIAQFEEATQTYKILKATRERRKGDLPTADDLVRDVFILFNKANPMLVEYEDMALSHFVNRELLEQMVNTKEFRDAHQDTEGDDLAATIAAIGAAERLMDTLGSNQRRKIEELAEVQAEIDRLLAALENVDEQLDLVANDPQPEPADPTSILDELDDDEDEDEESDDDEDDEGEEQEEEIELELELDVESEDGEQQEQESDETETEISPEEQALLDQKAQLQAALEAAQQKGQQVQDALAEELENNEVAARRAVKGAIEQAMQEIEEANNAVKAFGGGYDDSVSGESGRKKMTSKEKLELAQKVKGNRKLQNIAEMTGRFVRIAMSIQKLKVEQPPDEVIGVRTSQDIPHLLASETAYLGDPGLEAIFYGKFADEKLLTYELEKVEHQGKGPIIVALDSSGSMDSARGAANGKTREEWSKACAIALIAIAKIQKRDIAIIHFSSSSYHPGEGGLMRCDVFKAGEANPMQLLDTAAHFFGRGTDYSVWMKKARDLVQDSKFDKADVIVISDGDVSISASDVEAWNKLRKEREMRTYSLLIGNDGGSASYRELQQISESVTPLLSLTQDGPALETVFSI